MTTLYRKHVGGVGTWRIWTEGAVIHLAHATVEGGQEVVHHETVQVNQSGRNLFEQIQSRIDSRIRRQLDRGYTYDREEALKGNTNQLGLPLPMLAQKIKDVKAQEGEADLQLKLNGHRCLSTKQDGAVVMYSRRGKIINLPHIAEALRPLIPEGTFLDGELYHHGTKLQTIGSWIKKLQPDSEKLQYVCYDLMSPDTFRLRYAELSQILSVAPAGSPVRLLPCVPYRDEEHLAHAMAAARAGGYEGLIKRLNTEGYRDGVRSSQLLKVKAWDDCEVTVENVVLSPKGVVVCECRTDDGKRVDVVPPGNAPTKQDVQRFPKRYIGRRLTIEYSELTADGVPFHPVAREWWEDV